VVEREEIPRKPRPRATREGKRFFGREEPDANGCERSYEQTVIRSVIIRHFTEKILFA